MLSFQRLKTKQNRKIIGSTICSIGNKSRGRDNALRPIFNWMIFLEGYVS